MGRRLFLCLTVVVAAALPVVAEPFDVSAALLAGDVSGAMTGLEALQKVSDPQQAAAALAMLAERSMDLELAKRLWQKALLATTAEPERELIGARIELIDAVTELE